MLAVTQPVQRALSRGCDSWNLQLEKLSFERQGEATAKTDALRRILAAYNKARGTTLLKACAAKLAWLDTLEAQLGFDRCRRLILVNESRLLVHLGRASVLENVGLCADRVTGLPWIPGTALKGVLSTWAVWEANQDGLFADPPRVDRRRGDLASRIFGDNSPDGSKQAGHIIFVGGFPAEAPPLCLDIVNPHHNAQGRILTRLTPSAFLAVESGTMWHFVFFARPGVAAVKPLLEDTARWLKEALTQLGLGAKTAAGYGRFRERTAADRTRDKEQRSKVEAAGKAAELDRQQEQERGAQQAAARATLKSDYPNEATFRNRVLDNLDPGRLSQLQFEIGVLKKVENAGRLDKLKAEIGRASCRERV